MEEKQIFEGAESSVTLGQIFLAEEPVLRQCKSVVFQALPLQRGLLEPLCDCRAKSLLGKVRRAIKRVSVPWSSRARMRSAWKLFHEVLGKELWLKVSRLLCTRGVARRRKGRRCRRCDTSAFLHVRLLSNQDKKIIGDLCFLGQGSWDTA